MSMYKVKMEFDIVTPIFSYGADIYNSDIRIPTIKGLIRFWWRAVNLNMSLYDLRKEEVSIFGGKITEEGITESLKSKIIMNFYKNNKINLSSKKLELKYFLYPFSMGKEDKNREYIDEGSKFYIELKSKSKEYIEEALKGLLFLQYFGGIGSRNRRGLGGITIKIIEKDQDYSFEDLFDLSSIENEDILKERYEKLSKLILGNLVNNSYPILKSSNVYIFNPKKNWKSAIEYFEKKYSGFRRNHKGELAGISNFGLPVCYKDGSKIIAGKVQENDQDISNRIERIPSPIIFKAIKTQDGIYYPVLIHINGYAISGDYEIFKIIGNEEEHKKNLGKIDKNILNDFITEVTEETHLHIKI